MVDLFPLSPSEKLNLVCTVTSRSQLFRHLKETIDHPELYSSFLRREIEDLYGPITPDIERRLQNMRNIGPLTEELLRAKHHHKNRILRQHHIYRPSLRQQIYRLTRHHVSLPDISLSRLVSYTVTHMKTDEHQKCARQLAIRLIQQQLKDHLVAVDVSDFLHHNLAFSTPSHLKWTHLVLEVPSLACTS